MKKPDHSNCEKCANKDQQKSNHNWTVCPVMPVKVIIEGSTNCEKFIPIKE